jgi:2-polyprenyl-6-hydroxyphenyl methylase / 3-demethylubiquinone-9 3-methyltransferase
MINNEFYHDLGEKWYSSDGDVISLLRYENLAKKPWVLEKIKKFHPHPDQCRILDAGCGGGFLTMSLSEGGYQCTGVDISRGVVDAARSRDVRESCQWMVSPIEKMPFTEAQFDVVCMMDVLEHVADFQIALGEGLRVLKKDGTLLVHTFNRTWLAWLLAERGVEWFIRGTPRHLHDWNLFVKPRELQSALAAEGFAAVEFRGLSPVILSKAFFKLICTRRVPSDFRFQVGKSLQVGYLACARKI